jgi:hypothetical protein
MPKRKKKIIFDKERAESQHLPFRIPSAKPTEFHKDKSKYDRRRDKRYP